MLNESFTSDSSPDSDDTHLNDDNDDTHRLNDTHPNLPAFQPPSSTRTHIQLTPKSETRRRSSSQSLTLTSAEVEAVVSTFATFATFTGVRLRRVSIGSQSSKRIEDADFDRETKTYTTNQMLTGIGDLLGE